MLGAGDDCCWNLGGGTFCGCIARAVVGNFAGSLPDFEDDGRHGRLGGHHDVSSRLA